MKKVIASAAGILFGVFALAILGLLMTLTFGALGKLFPGNFINQLWGLVLFDIAAIVWALVFVYRSESTAQYAIAAIGFVASFVGTLGMVYIETLLGGQTFVEVADWVGEWLVYGFALFSSVHSALLYAHHATAPDISEKINVGIARGEIVTEAIKQATQSLDAQKAQLAQSITADIVNQVKRDLRLPTGTVIDLPALPVTYAETPAPQTQDKPGFSLSNLFPGLWPKSNTSRLYETATAAPAPTEEPYAYLRGEPLTREQAQEAVDMGFIDATGKGGTIPPQAKSSRPASTAADPITEEGTRADMPAPFRDGLSS
mgnify:CR=1 FL=1